MARIMGRFTIFSIVLVFLYITNAVATYCEESYTCTGYCQRRQRYTTRCFFIFRCTEYRYVRYQCDSKCERRVCCENWTGSDCSSPLCSGSKTCPNGGTCVSPNVCTCPRGYASPNCADINECASQNGECAHKCVNTRGSFACSCRSGYTLDSDMKGCLDINECLNNRNNGGCVHQCINTQGSFWCECNAGYDLNSDSRTCRDIDECTTPGKSKCDHMCQNTIGSYICSCDDGYTLALDRYSCEDVDECTYSTPVCDHKCYNTMGSYSCSCDIGYSLNDNGKTCTDIDECKSNNGNCLHTCTNNQGSYACLCTNGYQLNSDGYTCKDIDECKQGTSGCSNICNNIDGSFECSCPPGYSLAADQLNCKGVDECVGVTCQNGGTCVDGHLTYSCVCSNGFTGDHCQSDLDECALLNGGCQDACTNTFGSYLCSCSDNRTLSSNGATCEGYSDSDSVFRRYGLKGRTLPHGCWVIELASCTDGNILDIRLSSTSEWYSLENEAIKFTYGIVFAEVGNIAVPISLSGIEINDKIEDFQIRQGVTAGLERENVVGKLRTENCINASFSSNEKFEFIHAGSFLNSIFVSLIRSMPNWIDFKKSRTSIINVQDLKTELRYGHQIVDDPHCTGAPVFSDHLYSLFKFNTNFTMEIYGQAIDIPSTLGDEKICIIIDICQNNGATVFLINPQKNSDFVSKFGIMFQNGLIMEARGIGISLVDGINMTARKKDVQMWNGDELFNYPISERGNMWVGGGYRMGNGVFKMNGEADLFFKIPNIIDIFESGYLGETSVFFSHSNDVSLTLKMKVFGEALEIPFNEFVTIDSDIYMSVGGQDQRLFCGPDANPPGIFLSIVLSINPFRDVPILKDWVFDNTHKAYLFFVKNQDSSLLDFSSIDAIKDLLDLKDEFELFKTKLADAFGEVKQRINEELKRLLQNIRNAILTAIVNIDKAIPSLRNGNTENVIAVIRDTWRDIQLLNTEAKEFLDTTEILLDITTDTLTGLIKDEMQKIKISFNNILQVVNKQVSDYITDYDGFGIKYHVTLNIFGLKIIGVDVEMVYSESKLFSCSKYEQIKSLLDGKKAFRLLGRVSRGLKLGKFLKLDIGVGIGMALSLNSKDFIFQCQVFANILGVQATADLFILENKLTLYTELNVWDIFLAQVESFAQLGKDWHQLTLTVRGRFVANARERRQLKSRHQSFQGSYLSSLVKAVKQITDEIDKRLSQAQHVLSIAQSGLTAAQEWLANKRKALQKAHVVFDNAKYALQWAQNAVEKAKGPFQRAIKKLNDAKRKVDNLCKIRKCRKICIPGVRCKICWMKVLWFKIPFPCCKFTLCMISFPNPICVIANILCWIVRALAYAVLEAAKLVVRVVLLAFDIAKSALEVAEFVVDKSRVVVYLAEGIVALAELGLEGAKLVLEVAKHAIEAIKITIGLAFKVFEFVVEKGLKQIIDIRNCGFEIELSTRDLPVFDVSCEINAFSLGWKTVRLRINFKNIFQSIWQAAKATIKAIINGFAKVFGRRKRRDIAFESTASMHKFLRLARSSDSDIINTTQSAAEDILDTLQFNEGFKYNASTDYDNRVQIFREKCQTITNVISFLNESFITLFEIANETMTGVQEAEKIKSTLFTYNMTNVVENITLENSGISQEYAFNDYNLTSTELESALVDGKNKSQSDPLLLEIFASVDSASDDIDSEIAAAESVHILNHWLLAMENTTNEYFNESECVVFRDCVYHSIYLLYDLYTEEVLPDIHSIQAAISSLEDVFIELFQNDTSSIANTYNASVRIQSDINYISVSNLFCSRPPVMLEIKTNISAFIGSKVSIHCNAEADPKPSFTWFKDDQYLHGFIEEHFVIENVSIVDEGVYRCTAENIVANTTSEDIYLYVTADVPTEPPEVDDLSYTQHVVYISLGVGFGFLALATMILSVMCHRRRACYQVNKQHRPRTSVTRRREGAAVMNRTYASEIE